MLCVSYREDTAPKFHILHPQLCGLSGTQPTAHQRLEKHREDDMPIRVLSAWWEVFKVADQGGKLCVCENIWYKIRIVMGGDG